MSEKTEKLNRQELRKLIRWEYLNQTSAEKCFKKLIEHYGKNVVTRATVYNWYKRFRSGEDSIKDKDRPGRPQTFDEEKLRKKIETTNHFSTRQLERDLNLNKSSVSRYLKKMGMVCKRLKKVSSDDSSNNNNTSNNKQKTKKHLKNNKKQNKDKKIKKTKKVDKKSINESNEQQQTQQPQQQQEVEEEQITEGTLIFFDDEPQQQLNCETICLLDCGIEQNLN